MELGETITINKHTDILTYRGMTLTRKEVQQLNDAYVEFDEFKTIILDIDSEKLGLLEDYAGNIPE